ncbi:ABC transporter ATP-binding protein [Actinomadura harenae]|uniref:ATP-binding cassette domain-containing protein n=1 Tax=Actinomadura harenae TaxID=2483351 RepID=A0A3M2LM04_9ACTN|nr:ATP-binding cassette domain-containing protein [Actinomadura harenae]RMI38461.1 ATP-binding cassette domain-containing protein [Actinomadura harenae]
MIEVEGLCKRYGAVAAVDDLSFTAPPGVVTGFLGPNGAGKSTTMRMMLGLAAPDAGRALVGGRRYRELERPLRQVGALLETAAPHRGRSGDAHLRWLARSQGIGVRRVREVLELVGLAEAGRRRVGGYSQGMRQRLGLAAALLGDPAIVVLDEPANGLDPEGIRWLRGLLRGLASEGRTVLVSSHLIGEVARTADRLVVVARGRLVADAETSEFTGDLEDEFLRLTGGMR